ncbi:MAG: Crp/Fnr family transcriptional regulator [Alphaproteobacteria bacterium]|nr:Crp/Fnr family transcriptional regulator [Alphaproteobacteria bacterium]
MPKLAAADWDLVSAVPLFSGLERETLFPLLANARVRPYSPGAVLFLQGDPAERFFIVLNGWVKLWRETAAGDETVLGIFTRGESFAEAAIFDSARYPVNAEVVAAADLVTVPARPFINAIRSDPVLALRMLGSMSRHMRRLVAQLEQVQSRSAAQRVAGFLLRLRPAAPDSQVIELPYDKSLVAARLGMRPETFSRALQRLRDIGVEVQGGLVTVADVGALQQFCQDEPGP